jgi:Glycosyl transferase family 2
MLRKRGALTSADDSQRRKQQGQHCRCYNNRNGARLLKDCLGALSSQSYVHCEIVLVDNGSFDNSVRFAQRKLSRGKDRCTQRGSSISTPQRMADQQSGSFTLRCEPAKVSTPAVISELPSSQSPTGLDGGYLLHIV